MIELFAYVIAVGLATSYLIGADSRKRPEFSYSTKVRDSIRQPVRAETKSVFSLCMAELVKEHSQYLHYAKVDHRTIGQAVRMSRTLRGKWFIGERDGFNHEPSRHYLDMTKMPNLELVLLKVCSVDSQLNSEGGRVFLTKSGVYRRSENGSLTRYPLS